MKRLIPLRVVADKLGLKPSYVRKIAADQGRYPHKYPEATHERFPPFFRDGNSGWFTTETTLNLHLRKRGEVWETSL